MSTDIIINEDTGKPVKVDPSRRQLGYALHSRIEAAVLVTAMALKKISDDKLYLDMGFGSWKEYTSVLPFAYSTSKIYLQIATAFEPLLPSVTEDSKGQPVSLLESYTPENVQDSTVQELSSLGIRKLRALAQVEDADFSELPTSGEIGLPDGTRITIEEIRAQTVAEVERSLRDKKRKYLGQIRDAEQRAALAESERDALKKQAEDLESQKESLKALETRYGRVGMNYEAGKRKLSRLFDLVTQVNVEIGSMKMDDEVQEMLSDEIQNIHRLLDNARNKMKEHHLTAFEPWLKHKNKAKNDDMPIDETENQ